MNQPKHVHIYDATSASPSPRSMARWGVWTSLLALFVLGAAVAYVLVGIFVQVWPWRN